MPISYNATLSSISLVCLHFMDWCFWVKLKVSIANFLEEPNIISPFFFFQFTLLNIRHFQVNSKLINPFTAFQIFQGSTVLLIFVSVVFLILIFVSSFFIYRSWCRFFCLFGALSNSINKYYHSKLVRTDSCTNCGFCEQICPTEEAYRESTKAECYYCNRCIDTCPHDAIIWTKAV